ncbi:MAG: DUF2330 domain-containing protein, partial [Phycisphaerae bacterium]
MMFLTKSDRTILAAAIAASCSVLVSVATTVACGGFFCQQVPIDQAGEQIIFKKVGNQVTAVVLIQYEGEAEDFSWVVPVPGIPELSTGSELVFQPLEQSTRPQFNLIQEGSECESRTFDFALGGSASESADDGDAAVSEDGVTIVQQQAVGPFDTVVVTSDDPVALANWLTENNYDLTDRGDELIAPYVEEGMNFVALRLRQDQSVGDLQPLVMRYESEEIMVPIRLTAVAAMPDMGIVVWLLGEARGVPLNYLHVVPNYTRLDWYTGNAYASYQSLITSAMDEAGGQGFATDFAGDAFDASVSLPMASNLEEAFGTFTAIEDDASFLSRTLNEFPFQFFNVSSTVLQDKILEVLRRELPVNSEEGEFAYSDNDLLTAFFTPEELATARAALTTAVEDSIIEPLEETVALFEQGQYITRFYTTLSPEEMTVDPTFAFNPDLGDQAQMRSATMNVECTSGGTRWSLTLGEGTDRDGETVIEGTGTPPGFFTAVPAIDQDALFRSEEVTTSGPPTVVEQKQFTTAQ